MARGLGSNGSASENSLIAFRLCPRALPYLLAGALVQDFNAEPTDTFFTSRILLIGFDGFAITPLRGELHLDDQYRASFGTSSNQANDDFNVIFTGGGVSTFGFFITALDGDLIFCSELGEK